MATHLWDKVGGAAKEWAILDNRERIDSKNSNGFALFQSDIRVKDEQIENSASLIGEDGKSGIVGELVKKTSKHEKITEADIHKLMSATKGTNIRIFPE
jgi:hypothetical protein